MANKRSLLLYQDLKNVLLKRIFSGGYVLKNMLPPERDIAKEFKVSRVTVRKTLELLEEEKLISRIQGKGAMITPINGGFPGEMDTIALLAPANNPFFSSFFRQFEERAEKNSSLVILKQTGNSSFKEMVKVLFDLLQKEIRNFVIWPYDEIVDYNEIRRIKSFGANIVFFDRIVDGSCVDCVSVDNRNAVFSLYRHLKFKGIKNISYVGWSDFSVSSNTEREKAFLEISRGSGNVYNIPWKRERNTFQDISGIMPSIEKEISADPGFICGNGNIGIALKKYLVKRNMAAVEVCSVDDLPGADESGLTVYAQPMEEMAKKVFQRLEDQNRNWKHWKAKNYYIKGRLIRRK